MRRADGRDWDGIMHVNPQLKTKALIVLYNPLKEKIERTIKIPLYYTGLDKIALISQNGEAAHKYLLNRDYTVEIKVAIEAEGLTWFTIE